MVQHAAADARALTKSPGANDSPKEGCEIVCDAGHRRFVSKECPSHSPYLSPCTSLLKAVLATNALALTMPPIASALLLALFLALSLGCTSVERPQQSCVFRRLERRHELQLAKRLRQPGVCLRERLHREQRRRVPAGPLLQCSLCRLLRRVGGRGVAHRRGRMLVRVERRGFQRERLEQRDQQLQRWHEQRFERDELRQQLRRNRWELRRQWRSRLLLHQGLVHVRASGTRSTRQLRGVFHGHSAGPGNVLRGSGLALVRGDVVRVLGIPLLRQPGRREGLRVHRPGGQRSRGAYDVGHRCGVLRFGRSIDRLFLQLLQRRERL